MNMRAMTYKIMGCLLCMAAISGMAAEPTISDVVVKQRWPWSRLVDIDYMLTCDPNQKADVTLTARNGSQTLTLPSASLSGDLNGVKQGQKRIVWDPTVTSYTNDLTLTQFNVDLTPTEPPLYMIVDLTKSAGASGQIEYVTEADLTNNVWGAWVRDPVTNRGTVVHSVLWTGVTNNDSYKTDKLVLRRVPAGSFYLGNDDGTKENNVTLTKDMYVGVFEVTQQQWNRVVNNASGADTQAKHSVSYNHIRGVNVGTNWPASSAVDVDSFMGKLRSMTGNNEFDLPTEAQWEYFCKAETTTVFNDGNAAASALDATSTFLNVLGWYLNNTPTQPAAAQSVGGKLPNAWGLYDTHGNVWEWCLDWAGLNETGTDPKGAVSGTLRRNRGGCWRHPANLARSDFVNQDSTGKITNAHGLRVVRTLP